MLFKDIIKDTCFPKLGSHSCFIVDLPMVSLLGSQPWILPKKRQTLNRYFQYSAVIGICIWYSGSIEMGVIGSTLSLGKREIVLGI